jgi:hypothetical protein
MALRRTGARTWIATLALAGSAACAAAPSRPAAEPPPTAALRAPAGAPAQRIDAASPPRSAPIAIEPTRSDGALDAAPRPPPRTELRGAAPAYVIGGIKGRSSDALGRMLEPTQERVAACVPGTSGVIRVQVDSDRGRTVITIEPGIDLDPAARRCILEALSTMDVDDDPSKRLGPGGFTTHVLISW